MDIKAVASVAKRAGKLAVENADIVYDGARMGLDAKKKKNEDLEAKIRYRDYMQWKESGEDIEEFAFKRSELTGRPWHEIVENIKFHDKRQKQQPVLISSKVTYTDIKKYLQYADMQEVLGMDVTSNVDIPSNDLRELVGFIDTFDGDWTYLKRHMSEIADSGKSMREFPVALNISLRQALSLNTIPNYDKIDKIVEELCSSGEYDIIKDKTQRALMILYNKVR